MKKQLLKLKIKICNLLMKSNRLKLPISIMVFLETCERLKKENNYDTYTKDMICFKMYSLIRNGDINKAWGYDIGVDYYFNLYDYLVENNYIKLINNSREQFKINYINISKIFWNKLLPVFLSAITTLIINYILFLITKK